MRHLKRTIAGMPLVSMVSNVGVLLLAVRVKALLIYSAMRLHGKVIPTFSRSGVM